jgi:uncharacterized YigZ family protein
LKTVSGSVSQTYRVKGSRFIGLLFRSSSISHFESILRDEKVEYPTASHHCFAWRIGTQSIEEYANDDGEPSGTAGLPILNQMKSADLVNTGLIVTRYFGGTKLGKSGLIEAYGHTANLCIRHARLKTIIPTVQVAIRYPYSQQNLIDTWKSHYNLIEKNAEYLEEVDLTVACPLSEAHEFLAALQNSDHLLSFTRKDGIVYETV